MRAYSCVFWCTFMRLYFTCMCMCCGLRLRCFSSMLFWCKFMRLYMFMFFLYVCLFASAFLCCYVNWVRFCLCVLSFVLSNECALWFAWESALCMRGVLFMLLFHYFSYAWIYMSLYAVFEFVCKCWYLSLDFNFCPRFICRIDKYLQGRSNYLCLRTTAHSEYFTFIPQ